MINNRQIIQTQTQFSLKSLLFDSKVKLNLTTILLISSISILSGCSEDSWSNSKENFTQTYMEILIAREQVTDSTQAQTKVNDIMRIHGFDQQSFAQQFMEYSHTPDVLKSILDSAQTRARREITKAEPALKPEVLNLKKDSIQTNKINKPQK
ncbi:MAG: hypothetical protein JST20_02690 [Bacteroidetes bacterium]|nr:hypothetical protein [Bacteroidota bacterium]